MYKQSALFAYWMLMRKTQANYINPYVHKQACFLCQRFTLSSVCKKLSKCIVKGSGSSRWWDFSHQNINGSNTRIAIKPSIGWRTSGHHIAFQRASNKCAYTSQENVSENQAFWKLPWKPLESLTYFCIVPASWEMNFVAGPQILGSKFQEIPAVTEINYAFTTQITIFSKKT